MSRRDQVEQWINAVWTQGNVDAIETLMAPEFSCEGMLPQVKVGVAEFADLVTMTHDLMTGIDARLVLYIEKDDWSSIKIDFRCKVDSSAREVAFSSISLMRFEDDKVVEAHNLVDFMKLFEDLGQLPENSAALGLSGHRFS